MSAVIRVLGRALTEAETDLGKYQSIAKRLPNGSAIGDLIGRTQRDAFELRVALGVAVLQDNECPAHGKLCADAWCKTREDSHAR